MIKIVEIFQFTGYFPVKLEKELSFNDIVARAMAETSEIEYHPMTSFNVSPIKLKSNINSLKTVPKVVRKYQIHTKTYSPKWELDPNYRGWVQRSERGDGFFYCLACSKDYTCGKSELDKHASSKKHCLNLKSMIAAERQVETNYFVKTNVGHSVENMFLDDVNSSSISFEIDEVLMNELFFYFLLT